MNDNNQFEGFHGEWNLGSPGGWEYQKMIQEIYQPAWQKIKELTGVEVDLDLDNHYFKPSLNFADLLVEASRKEGKDPFIALVAEEETLRDVIENKRIIDYLNSLEGVTSQLIGPRKLRLVNNKLVVDGREVTAIFMDFNTSVLVELEKRHSINPLIKAIEGNILINPRGMEPVGTKGVFEVVTDKYKNQLSQSTVSRTPWTKKFFKRATISPDGEPVDDLLRWTADNWNDVILKPEHGWSGKGIIVCPEEKDIKGNIKKALLAGNYIVQKIIPKNIWSEMLPDIDEKYKKVVLKERQTDFRCLVSNKGLVGFVARYGGIPTNVGSGGGVQALAVVKSNHSPKEAAQMINGAILSLDFDKAKEIRQIINKGALDLEFIYLNGPIPIGLRPRILSQKQIEALEKYGRNLYQDTLILEKIWHQGGLEDIVKITEREKQIAKLQPRTDGMPAMIASDGLFNFGAALPE